MKKNVAKIVDADQGKVKSILGFASFIFTRPGLELVKRVVRKKLTGLGILKERKVEYASWIAEKKKITTLKEEYDTTITSLSKQPQISIVLSGSNSPIEYNDRSVKSINEQLYTNWEVTKTGEGIPMSFEDAIAEATGDWIMFMSRGDMLTPDCLFKFVRHINKNPDDELIYADEDHAKTDVDFSDPYFKPGWSPDSLLTRNYIGNSFIIKKSLAVTIRDIDAVCTTYDLVLKASEKTDRIARIPEVLFHTCERIGNANIGSAEKKVIQDALSRRNTPGSVSVIPGLPGAFTIEYEVRSFDKVSIVIPTKDQAGLLKAAIDSILAKTDYPAYEIIVLNNNSSSGEFSQLMETYTRQHADNFRCIDASFPFNFARLMNLGVSESKGKYILMFNNDLEVIHADWIHQMVGYAQHEHTGAVGTKLLYPDETIQHAGVVLGINGDAGHVFVNMPRDTSGYFNNVKTATNYSAVTAACLMCRKSSYTEVGGMDEYLEVEYNDIDLCLKLLKQGYYNVYLPTVELYHHESATRGHPFSSKASWKQHDKEYTIFKSKWRQLVDNDPFYNPNLSRAFTDFRL